MTSFPGCWFRSPRGGETDDLDALKRAWDAASCRQALSTTLTSSPAIMDPQCQTHPREELDDNQARLICGGVRSKRHNLSGCHRRMMRVLAQTWRRPWGACLWAFGLFALLVGPGEPLSRAADAINNEWFRMPLHAEPMLTCAVEGVGEEGEEEEERWRWRSTKWHK